jgi:Icc-related predicted phosphoesterase
MKIAFLSDAHLDFKNATANLMLHDLPDADIMVIAGDLVEVCHIDAALPFLRACNEKYEKTIWIPGNHEYYGSEYSDVDSTVRLYLDQNGFVRVFYTSQGVVSHNGIKIVCGTLWTDFNRGNPLAELAWASTMNDAVMIKDSSEISGTISRTKIKDAFDATLGMIKDAIAGGPCVVVTHHAPSYSSVSRMYAGQLNNAFYASNLDYMLANTDNILCWIHGHLHDAVDYNINQTRVISNPVGYYGYEQCANKFKHKVIDV